jgi:ankyrin repeat protein
MTRASTPAVVFGCALALASCATAAAPYGGEPEKQLAAATIAGDVGKVAQLLASGANPNKVVRVESDDESPWYLALYWVRERRPESVDIIKLMLKAGANPNEAWGTSGVGRRRDSAWRRFFTSGNARQAGLGADNPMRLAMSHPVPGVVRALVAAGFNPRNGESALVDAVEYGNPDIVHALVEAGVDVNCYPGPNTPLVAAIEARNVALMTYLEEHGAREKP